MLPGQYSFEERAQEKQNSRDEDARALVSGESSREQLRHENGAFAFPNVEIDLKASERLW